MISIGANTPASLSALPLPEPKDQVAEAKSAAAAKELKDATSAPLSTKTEEGVKVTFSGAALLAISDTKKSNSDIEESGLPDDVQQVLKMIREIKKQIAEKQAELAAVMADKTLSPEQARVKVNNLQSALAALNASLVTAQGSLSKAMKGLSGDDAMKAASLAMA
ncbi:hypothetical protein [Pseudomonas orientalis]|uniref:hypothetical protein n=1 Tax=Pseudomonas orientalis TaxID=76758 RepID=UPI00197EE29D|nr:hypothetical protein [Pseudomonas orientalis]